MDPAMGLTLPRGAVKVLTPCSLGALVLGKGLVTGIATCSLLVWDDCSDCPQGPPFLPQLPQIHTERKGKAKQTHHCGPQSTSVCRLSLKLYISVQSVIDLFLYYSSFLFCIFYIASMFYRDSENLCFKTVKMIIVTIANTTIINVCCTSLILHTELSHLSSH